ncbi:hypothetical protein EKO27_g3280 [Xylaria grammica]|uniref:SUN domain-containing protein n=1 Tax=Xylaria grammica TaxID=363999 RepID=A0A439DBV8_9PEZI|nr:hypothetical protein EKO27_g3280 [Xylaria grammica]
MWSSVKGRFRVLASLSLVSLLLPDITYAQGEGTAATPRDAAKSSSSALSLEPTCESRTVNYITDSLPQQCLTTGPITSIPVSDTASVAPTNSTSASTSSLVQASDAVHDELESEGEDLSTGAFMSFEEWKAMMLAKSGPEALDTRPRRQKDGRADAAPGDGFDSLGDEGEISFDFDSYSDKISEIASSARPHEREKETKEQVEVVAYEEGFTYYRSKDAGTTCKERFSYSSFDAGATVKKTSPGAKNPTAILVENKDSYMLLECGRKNKFFIVELSDVILVDTVVIANFEFFSSMVRQFRVSISDHYPVKLDKWKVLGTFQARNSRDIQPFLIENPQDWARYLRVEILSHYGNEYYCPVSLLRVHGLRMLDSWKQVDPSELEGEDESSPSISEPVGEAIENAHEPPGETEVVEPVPANNHSVIAEQSCWMPYWDGSYFGYAFPLATNCARENSPGFHIPISSNTTHPIAPAGPRPTSFGERAISTTPNTSSTATAANKTAEPSAEVPRPRVSVPGSVEWPMSVEISVPTPSSSGSRDTSAFTATSATSPSTENATLQNTPKSKSSASTSIRPPSSRSSAKASSSSQTTIRNKTSTTASSPLPTPTVQDSFFKALTKRLQILESNTTLSLQYIESQSKFLQEALAKLERRQIAKVDLFLDKLNNTVLSELREVRTLYDHIWQSTVIALESQREQTEHEIVALSARVGVLADEVVFQKRMAIIQSVLLLGCLVLVIFSRGFAGSAVEAYYPSQFLASSSRLASPIVPSTPKAQPKPARPITGLSGDSAGTTPARTRATSHSTQTRLRTNDGRSSSQTPKQQSRTGSKGIDLGSGPRPQTPTRALSDPSGLDYQPLTPSSIDDMAYDSEPAMTPNGDYFSAVTSVNGDSSIGGEGEELSMAYPERLVRQSERQLTPTPDAEASEYIKQRSGRPGLAHSSSTRGPLPALPEDPD